MSKQIISFFSFCIGSFFICISMILTSYFLGGKSKSKSKNIQFESGIGSSKNTCLNFSIKFYLIAIFFVIFDIESLYLYSWSVSIKENGWFGFLQATIYILLMLISLLYIIKSNLIYWRKKKFF